MLISAIICTYQRYEILREVLAALIAQDLPESDYRIIVIDNSPDAALSRRAARRWRAVANLTWHHEPTPGLSHARNVGLDLARTSLVSFLDDDAVADRDWLSAKLAAFAFFGPAVHAVGGRVRLRLEGGRPDWLDQRMLGWLSACDLGDTPRLIRPGEWVVGANISYRTAAVRAAGGFDTALGRVGGGATLMSNDEIDLQHRLAAGGGATGYAPAAAVEHIVPKSRLRQAWFRRRAAWQAISDFVQEPDARQRGGPEAWVRSKGFLATCKPADRTLRGLALHEPRPDRFYGQVNAIYDTVHAVLAGLEESDEG
jgi:GT2 family glycosyltransferase